MDHKRYSKPCRFNKEMQLTLFQHLLASGRIKSRKDLCRYGVCPVVVGCCGKEG